jgi:hypothetical protein
MRILELKALRGPNYWSGYWTKLIVMRLDLEDYEEKPTDKLDDFEARLAEVVPSIKSHGCSYQEEGGFLRRVAEGTWAGHVIEHLALELQTLAGMDTGYGRTRGTTQPGVYNVVFNYKEEDAGRYAARAAVASSKTSPKACRLMKSRERLPTTCSGCARFAKTCASVPRPARLCKRQNRAASRTFALTNNPLSNSVTASTSNAFRRPSPGAQI